MRSIIKRSQVRLGQAGHVVRSSESPSHVTPKVGARLIDLDGKTKAIEFTCSCGETSLIEIQCEEKS